MTALIELAGAVALLLWGVHMVRSGVTRAFGAELRTWLRGGLGNRLMALVTGLGVTTAIQSSTATALMAGGFAARGLIALPAGLAVMAGANIGSSLIVHALGFDTGPAAWLLILAGLAAFQRSRARLHDLGRAGIGLGLMLLALRHLVAVVATLSPGPAGLRLLAELTADPLACVAAAALLAALAHSGVAVVLLTGSLAAAGLVPPAAALALVLGANLGSAVNPVLVLRREPAGLRLAAGNLANRLVGCAIALPLLPLAEGLLGPAAFNTAFNLALAVAWLPLLPLVAAALRRAIPDPAASEADPHAPRHLDPAALAQPAVALANATREALRMTEVVDAMLRGAQAILHGAHDRGGLAEVRAMDKVLDGLHAAIALYLSRLPKAGLAEAEARRLAEILAFSLNLEHAGDVVERSLLAVAAKKLKRQIALPPESLAQIDDLFARLRRDLQLAGAVFLSGDAASARALFAGKEAFREAESGMIKGHFASIRAGHAASLETGGVLLDTLRDLKRIESHLAASAQPVLSAHGLLRASRLTSAA